MTIYEIQKKLRSIEDLIKIKLKLIMNMLLDMRMEM